MRALLPPTRQLLWYILLKFEVVYPVQYKLTDIRLISGVRFSFVRFLKDLGISRRYINIMSAKTKEFLVRIEPNTYDEFKRICEINGVSASSVVRDLMNRYIQTNSGITTLKIMAMNRLFDQVVALVGSNASGNELEITVNEIVDKQSAFPHAHITIEEILPQWIEYTRRKSHVTI